MYLCTPIRKCDFAVGSVGVLLDILSLTLLFCTSASCSYGGGAENHKERVGNKARRTARRTNGERVIDYLHIKRIKGHYYDYFSIVHKQYKSNYQ